MIAFERLLSDKGYKAFFSQYNKETKELEYIKPYMIYPSTMGHCSLVYIKGDRKIECGLSEYKKPPTLIWPRPTIVIELEDGYGMSTSDDHMNRVLKEEDLEKVYEALFNKSIIFTIKNQEK